MDSASRRRSARSASTWATRWPISALAGAVLRQRGEPVLMRAGGCCGLLLVMATVGAVTRPTCDADGHGARRGRRAPGHAERRCPGAGARRARPRAVGRPHHRRRAASATSRRSSRCARPLSSPSRYPPPTSIGLGSWPGAPPSRPGSRRWASSRRGPGVSSRPTSASSASSTCASRLRFRHRVRRGRGLGPDPRRGRVRGRATVCAPPGSGVLRRLEGGVRRRISMRQLPGVTGPWPAPLLARSGPGGK